MTEPNAGSRREPFADADEDPPVPVGEPSRETEEAARRDFAIRGAAAGGAMAGAAGYASGGLTGTGGAIGARLTEADEEAEAAAASQDADAPSPEAEAQVASGPPDTPGIDPPVGALEDEPPSNA